jgi:hypothetical protein
MTLATCLESLRAAARRDAEKLEDDVLIDKDPRRLAETIAERHYLEPLRLHNAMVGQPRAAILGVAGEPGLEEPGGGHVPVPATRVDLLVPLDGVKTLALLVDAAGDLDLAGGEVDVAEKRLVVGYVSEHPNAAAANDYFDHCLATIEETVHHLGAQVQEFNQSLAPAIAEALAAAKGRAKARRKFAAGLKQPRTFDRWGGPA